MANFENYSSFHERGSAFFSLFTKKADFSLKRPTEGGNYGGTGAW